MPDQEPLLEQDPAPHTLGRLLVGREEGADALFAGAERAGEAGDARPGGLVERVGADGTVAVVVHPFGPVLLLCAFIIFISCFKKTIRCSRSVGAKKKKKCNGRAWLQLLPPFASFLLPLSLPLSLPPFAFFLLLPLSLQQSPPLSLPRFAFFLQWLFCSSACV